MPLNFKGESESTPKIDGKIEPILHQPSGGNSLSRRIIVAVIVVAVLLCAVVFVYRSGILTTRTQSARTATTQTPERSAAFGRDSSPSVSQQLHNDALQPKNTLESSSASHQEQRVTGSLPNVPGTPVYTVYIARQTDRARADDEAGRWSQAGYESRVTVKDGWYCVSIGRFDNKSDAQELAEKFADAFESGSWVGPLEQ